MLSNGYRILAREKEKLLQYNVDFEHSNSRLYLILSSEKFTMVNSGIVYFAILKAHTSEFGEMAQWVKVKGTWFQF